MRNETPKEWRRRTIVDVIGGLLVSTLMFIGPCMSYKMPPVAEKLLPSWGDFFSRTFVWGAAEG